MRAMLNVVKNGLGLTLVAALICSGCGDDDQQTATCTPASCAGCCQNGICMDGLSTTACGAEGAICIICPEGTTCQEGQCRQENSGCTGCLNAAGACVPGTTVDACGAGGVSCDVCSGTQMCAAGVCQESCNFLTCADGCCQAGQCIEPPTNQACGLRGEPCEQCESNQTCESGQCASEVVDCANDCEGCCQNNKCLAGDTKSACGVDGEACQACGADQACHEGSCQDLPEPCGPDTCDGCCTAEGCLPIGTEQTLQACGKDGNACNSCPEGSLSCTQGICVEEQPCFAYCTQGCCTLQGQCVGYDDQSPTQCGDNGDLCAGCGDNLSCLEGDCVSDPVYDVLVLSAVIAEKNPEGEDWDSYFGVSPPDPFVRAGLIGSGATNDSDVIKNTFTPNWAVVNNKVGSYTASQITNTGLQLAIYDDDTGPINDLIGYCTFQPTAVPTSDQTLATCGKSVTDFKFRFVKQ